MVDALQHPLPELSEQELAALARDLFGLEGTVAMLGGERHLNAMVDCGDFKYTLKVARAGETPSVPLYPLAALNHIRDVDPSLPVPRVVPSLDGRLLETLENRGLTYHASALTYLAGEPVSGGPLSAETATVMGSTLARLQRALQGFFHASIGRRILWDARRAGELIAWTPSIPDPPRRQAAVDALRSVVGLHEQLARHRAQAVHNDFNRANLLTAPGAPGKIVGILDFGDMIHAPRVLDLAVAMTYASLEHANPLEPAASVVAGFSQLVSLSADEIDLLPQLVTIRLAQSLTIAHHRAALHPDNAEYILSDAHAVKTTFDQWLKLDSDETRDVLSRVAGVRTTPAPSPELVERRERSLWSGLRVMYDAPLHLVRGDGVWLVDVDGRRYLDAYNNVMQVGHGNRRVIHAASAQARELNTNTRYLTEPVVQLAEQITRRLPDPLSVCLFVNSGSEANDLAWRIAKAVTTNTGSITTVHAYHGWTEATYSLSPEERPANEAPDSAAMMAAPGGVGSTCSDAVELLARRGHQPAAVWFDATFSSDGVRFPKPGYLRAAVEAVRRHGGLAIADEVQGGLGRVGTDYWAFAADDIVPDIVTLGKPLGNGYPIGAVVTSRDIAERFAERGYFFSTFGGNPVSAAASLMVLRITDELDLPGRAEVVGSLLITELPRIVHRIAPDAAVRGRGAFVGIDLGDGDLTRSFVQAMRREGVLVSQTGPGGTVVKIRPPLIFSEQHAGLLLEAASAAVAVLG